MTSRHVRFDEVVFLVLEFLKDHNLDKARAALLEDTGLLTLPSPRNRVKKLSKVLDEYIELKAVQREHQAEQERAQRALQQLPRDAFSSLVTLLEDYGTTRTNALLPEASAKNHCDSVREDVSTWRNSKSQSLHSHGRKPTNPRRKDFMPRDDVADGTHCTSAGSADMDEQVLDSPFNDELVRSLFNNTELTERMATYINEGLGHLQTSSTIVPAQRLDLLKAAPHAETNEVNVESSAPACQLENVMDDIISSITLDPCWQSLLKTTLSSAENSRDSSLPAQNGHSMQLGTEHSSTGKALKSSLDVGSSSNLQEVRSSELGSRQRPSELMHVSPPNKRSRQQDSSSDALNFRSAFERRSEASKSTATTVSSEIPALPKDMDVEAFLTTLRYC